MDSAITSSEGGTFSSLSEEGSSDISGTRNVTSPPPDYTEYIDDGQRFHLFLDLPSEIRLRIWELALKPRIVKRQRINDDIVYTAPSNSLTLLSVCQESRAAAFLYAQYRFLSQSSHTYFSPVLDYLWLFPGWELGLNMEDDLSNFPWRIHFPELHVAKHVMIPHSQKSNNRSRRPSSASLLAQFFNIKSILLAADEKSLHSTNAKGYMDHITSILGEFKATKVQYDKNHPNGAEFKIPYIAVGCVGWTGVARRVLHHGSQDNRQLIATFETLSEMKTHIASLRAEEWGVSQGRVNTRPKIFEKLRLAMEADRFENEAGNATSTLTIED